MPEWVRLAESLVYVAESLAAHAGEAAGELSPLWLNCQSQPNGTG